MPFSSQPPQQVPQNLIENEDLAWGKFGTAIIDTNVAACYNMSLRDFEHSGVHDLFKVCKLFPLFYFYYFFNYIYINIYIYIYRYISSFSNINVCFYSNEIFIQAMSKFITASKQATELDKTRILLERRIQEVKDASKRVG